MQTAPRTEQLAPKPAGQHASFSPPQVLQAPLMHSVPVAEQAPTPPRVFVRIHLIYTVRGTGLSRKAVEDSVALSKNKYCSASIMLGKAAEIDYEIVYPDGEPEP